MSRWDSSTGTILYWPDRAGVEQAAPEVSATLEPAALIAMDDEAWHNPMAWMDRKGQGAFLRILPLRSGPHGVSLGWGGVEWDNVLQAEAVLSLAESLAMRTVNRWYALCDYAGWDDECEHVTDVPSFGEFRVLLRATAPRDVRKGRNRARRYRVHPAECHVYKVHGPMATER